MFTTKGCGRPFMVHTHPRCAIARLPQGRAPFTPRERFSRRSPRRGARAPPPLSAPFPEPSARFHGLSSSAPSIMHEDFAMKGCAPPPQAPFRPPSRVFFPAHALRATRCLHRTEQRGLGIDSEPAARIDAPSMAAAVAGAESALGRRANPRERRGTSAIRRLLCHKRIGPPTPRVPVGSTTYWPQSDFRSSNDVVTLFIQCCLLWLGAKIHGFCTLTARLRPPPVCRELTNANGEMSLVEFEIAIRTQVAGTATAFDMTCGTRQIMMLRAHLGYSSACLLCCIDFCVQQIMIFSQNKLTESMRTCDQVSFCVAVMFSRNNSR